MSRLLNLFRSGLDILNDGLSQVLELWKVEVGATFPLVARVSGSKRPYVLLRLGQESSDAQFIAPGAVERSEEKMSGVELPGVTRLDALAERLKPIVAGRPIHLSMTLNATLTMKFDLPVAARRALRSAVAYRLLTESPVEPSLLVFDAKPGKASFSAQQIQVEVAVAQREKVEEIVNTLTTRGIRVDAVGLAPLESNGLEFVFWRSSTAESGLAQLRLHRRLLASACLFVLIWFPLTTLAAKWLERQARIQISEIRSPDPQQLSAQARSESVVAQRKDLLGQMPVVPLTRLIDEVAKSLPTDAWVNRLEYGYGKLALGVQAGEPFVALRGLRLSAPLANAKLDGVARPANPGEPSQVEVNVVISGLSVPPQGVAGHPLGEQP